MMSGNDLITFCRGLIHEAVPDFWDPPTILVNLNASQKLLVLKMQKAADHVFYTSCTIPTISGIQKYALPDGSLYTAAKKCTGKIDLILHENSLPLEKGDWRQFLRSGTGKPLNVRVVGGYIYVYPIPNAVYPLTLWYPYFPDAIVATGTPIDFLEGFEPLIAYDAAITSFIKDEADLSDINMRFATLWADFIETYCGERDSSGPASIPDDLNDPDD